MPTKKTFYALKKTNFHAPLKFFPHTQRGQRQTTPGVPQKHWNPFHAALWRGGSFQSVRARIQWLPQGLDDEVRIHFGGWYNFALVATALPHGADLFPGAADSPPHQVVPAARGLFEEDFGLGKKAGLSRSLHHGLVDHHLVCQHAVVLFSWLRRVHQVRYVCQGE